MEVVVWLDLSDRLVSGRAFNFAVGALVCEPAAAA